MGTGVLAFLNFLFYTINTKLIKHRSDVDQIITSMIDNNKTMKFVATLLLAAIHTTAFVEADAFISASPAAVPKRGQGYAKVPLTKAGSSHQHGVATTSALKMSGGDAVSTEGTASIPDEVFNLVKSIVGAGVLSLPAGEYPNMSINSQFILC